MTSSSPSLRRLAIVAVIAAAVLLAIVIATGNQTLSSPSGAPAVTTQPATAAPTTAAAASGSVQAVVSASARHLSGHTWRFRYTIRPAGKTPVAGFQITGPNAHLFNVVGHGWNFYGTGVCHHTGPAGLLIYWSTNSASNTIIRPGKSAVFGFDVNTTGPSTAGYSLSYGTAAPKFGQVQAPSSSKMPPSVPCA